MSSFEEIPAGEKNTLLAKQTFELSYETIPHTKVSPDYNVCLGIPVGTKGFVFMTFFTHSGKSTDVVYMMETNKERKIAKVTKTRLDHKMSIFANGTLLYGTFVPNDGFVIEDILMYQGIPTKQQLFSERLGFIEKFLQTWVGLPRFHMAPLWPVIKEQSYDCVYDVPVSVGSCMNPSFHHIQYRCLTKVAPYLNIYPAKKSIVQKEKDTGIPFEIHIPYRNINLLKPQYKQLTVFKVRADIAFDIYRLYAFGPNNTQIYYNVAYIPNYKTSVFMNGLFRNIRENQNLDAIEESDDESDFEDIAFDKYVDLQKTISMECRFHQKFKKWVPIRVVDARQKVVHIGQL